MVISREVSDKHAQANTLSGLGAIYDQLKSHEKFIELLQAVINIWHEIDDYCHEAVLKFNLGVTFGKPQQNRKTTAAYQNSRELFMVMELDAEVQHCNTALQRLADPSNLLLDFLKQISRFLRRLFYRFW